MRKNKYIFKIINTLVMKMKLHKRLNVKKNSIKTSYFKGLRAQKIRMLHINYRLLKFD